MNRKLTIILIKKESGYEGYFNAYHWIIEQGKTREEVIKKLIFRFDELNMSKSTKDMFVIKKY